MDWVTILVAVITAGFAYLGVYTSNRKQAALSAGGFGFVTAILLALTGLPEAEEK